MLRPALATLSVLFFLGAVTAQPAKAGSGINVGALKCNVGGGIGFIIGSSKDLKCTFVPAGDAPAQWYSGSINSFGVDIGYTKHGVIIWGVFAPTNEVGAGTLAGTYIGATAKVAAAVGVGADALVGGGNSIALQPLSLEGMTGLNVAAGIAKVTLKHVNR